MHRHFLINWTSEAIIKFESIEWAIHFLEQSDKCQPIADKYIPIVMRGQWSLWGLRYPNENTIILICGIILGKHSRWHSVVSGRILQHSLLCMLYVRNLLLLVPWWLFQYILQNGEGMAYKFGCWYILHVKNLMDQRFPHLLHLRLRHLRLHLHLHLRRHLLQHHPILCLHFLRHHH